MTFGLLAEYFSRLDATSKRLEMFDALAEMLSGADASEVAPIIYLSQGRLAPAFMGVETGMSEKFILRALSEVSGRPSAEVEALFNEKGDLGLVAEGLLKGGGQGLTVLAVYDEIRTMADLSGKGSQDQKINLLASLLRGVSPLEARYIVRIVQGKLRLGIGDPTVLEALAAVELARTLGIPLQGVAGQSMKKDERIALFESTEKNVRVLAEVDAEMGEGTAENKRAEAYFKRLLELRQALREKLERAYNLCSDLGLVAKTLMAEGADAVRAFTITVGYPIRMALCERVPTSADIIEKMNGLAAIEAKYDGLRLQVHKDGERVEMFSRNLERLTEMFPEIAEAVRALPVDTLIIEGEAIAFNEDTGELLPFQETIKRRRKHNVEGMAQNLPLRYFAFELLYMDGVDYTVKPYEARRAALERIVGSDPRAAATVVPAVMFKTSDAAEIDLHFEEFLETGLEGVIAKRLDSPYAAGARNFNWIKLKRSYRGELADTVDICVVGYFRGKGSRAKFGVGALLGAVYDTGTDRFVTVSKVGSGFTELELAEVKAKLDEIALTHPHARVHSLIEPDVWVAPRHVLTVTADEITRSPSHTAGMTEAEPTGYALRFPRATGMFREDKSPEDATTVDEIKTMFNQQRQIKSS
jgi:DNA ligase-1